MIIKLKPPIKDYKLKSDPGKKAAIVVRQARTGENIRIGELFSKINRVWNDKELGVVRQEWDFNALEQIRFQAYLTLVGASDLNFTVDDEAEGKQEPLFKFKNGKYGPELDMTQDEFNERWGLLPSEISEEIYEFVLDMNPQWDTRKQGE